MIEVFIPVILYKYGYNIKEILSIIGIIAFSVLQILLNFMTHNIWYLLSIAILFAIYRRGYWISRRYYNLKVIKKEHISTTYSIISIINQIGVVISAYMGSILLDYVSLNAITIIAIILFLLSIVPLYLLKFKHEKTNIKLEFMKNLKQIPRSDIYLFGTYELMNVVKFLIPLYLFIYVKNTYQTIGVVNLITNLSLMIFTYFFAKKLDVSKKNFLAVSIILTVVVYILKINFLGYTMLIISFIEGFVIKMYELAISKEFYTLSKKFEYNNYNLIYEIIQNSFRSFTLLIFLLFNFELKTMIYITLVFILFGVFLTFKQVDSEYKT